MLILAEQCRACIILFGHDHGQCQGQRLHITLDSLKSQYRKKIIENHPDRAALLGRSEDELTEQAILITQSYELLMEHLTRNTMKDPRVVRHKTRRVENFAQFLHDNDIISLSIQIDALAWQQTQAPYYTTMARELGIATHDAINEIFSKRTRGEQFEDTARRLGRISAAEDERIREEIRRRTPLLHEYFIVKGILPPERIEELLETFVLSRAS